MIKFLEKDFKYMTRYKVPWGYCYTFSVHNNSASYLIKEYKLEFPIIWIHLLIEENENLIRIVSKTNDSLNIENYSIKEKDVEELLPILINIANKELIRYDEFSTGLST